jgi:ATP-dependent Clp protease ATP-binding subunit ClpB
MSIDFDEQAKQWLADKGYDEVYGARPLKRVIQKDVLNPLATMILQGSVKDGDHISVKCGADGNLEFDVTNTERTSNSV